MTYEPLTFDVVYVVTCVRKVDHVLSLLCACLLRKSCKGVCSVVKVSKCTVVNPSAAKVQ